jgi:uncharacterized protein with PQ loop repeat
LVYFFLQNPLPEKIKLVKDFQTTQAISLLFSGLIILTCLFSIYNYIRNFLEIRKYKTPAKKSVKEETENLKE